MSRVAIVTAVCTLGFATSAYAGWSSPFTVASSSVGSPGLATSATHGASIGWLGRADPNGRSAFKLRPVGPTGRLGRARGFPVVVSLSGPKFGVSRSGAAVAVWAHPKAGDRYALRARRISARGKLGPVRTLAHDSNSFGEGLEEQLVGDAAGNAIVVWHRVLGAHTRDGPLREASLHMRRFDANGSLGPIVDVPTEGGFDFSPRLAVEPSGRAMLVWSRSTGSLYGIRASRIDRAGRLAASRELSVPGSRASDPDVALEATGRATVTWLANSGAGDAVAARRISGRDLSPVHTLTPPSDGSYFGRGVAVDRHGTATVAWRDGGSVPNFTNVVGARQIRADESLGPLRTLSALSTGVSDPGLAADGLGRTTVAWTRRIGVPAADVVQTRAFARDGRLGATRTLYEERPGSIGDPQIVGDARGVLTAAWSSSSGILAARFVPR